MVEYIFRDCPFVIVYLDDLVVLSKNLEENLVNLGEVFDNICEQKLNLKPNKFSFEQLKVEHLGH